MSGIPGFEEEERENNWTNREGRRLDPEDRVAFRRQFHELLDACLDRMDDARDLPWRPVPEGYEARIAPGCGAGGGEAMTRMVAEIMPYATGNTHPRFWGWVHGTGLPISVAADLVAATMNSNLGGRDHGAVRVEVAVIDWLKQLIGMPERSTGVMTSGTSQASLLSLSVARKRLFPNVRKSGIANSDSEIRVYIAEGGHSCVVKALEVMGHGSDALCRIALDDRGAMDLNCLEEALDRDRSKGILPLAVVGTAGSVDTGTFDPFDELADLCGERGIWLHADAAFGLWTMLAEPPWRDLARGIHRVDSLGTDCHKWIGVTYDCGICLIADGDLHRATFTGRPDYLQSQPTGLAGGETWFADYGIELSRGFRGLKVWAAIEEIGIRALGAAITDNCRQAALMGELACASSWLDLAHPVVSNICCFTPRHGQAAEIAAALQLGGEAVFSTTRVRGRECLRAAIVNHRTTSVDVREAVEAAEKEVSTHTR